MHLAAEGSDGAGRARAALNPCAMGIRITLLAAIVALAACSSPTQSIDFQPPAGWTATPSFFGFQAWHTTDRKQTLVLVRLPVTVDPKTAMQHSEINNMETYTQKSITICGKHPAILITGRGMSSQSHGPQDVEMLMTSYSGATYLAVYARDVGTPMNAQANHAVYSLCQRS